MHREMQFAKEKWRLTFGKYYGKRLRDVVNLDPSYIIWIDKNIDWLTMDPKILDRAWKLILKNQSDMIRARLKTNINKYID